MNANPTEYWVQDRYGNKQPLSDETVAYTVARRIYPDDDDPQEWVMLNHHDGEGIYVLVPGGPEDEEFTWMPYAMWAEGGVMSLLDK